MDKTIQSSSSSMQPEPLIKLLSTEIGQWWLKRIKFAGIGYRHAPAHLTTNTKVYAEKEGKKKAYKTSLMYAKKGFTLRNEKLRHSMMFCGSVGTGKTWLATAVFKYLMYGYEHNNNSSFVVSCYWRGFRDIIREVQATYSDKSTSSDSVITNYKRCKLLLIDDFGDMDSGKSSDDQRSIVFDILDYRNSNGASTLFTTNLELGEMEEKWGKRLFDRIMEMSSVLKVSGDNLRRTMPEDPEHRYLMDILKLMPDVDSLLAIPKPDSRSTASVKTADYTEQVEVF